VTFPVVDVDHTDPLFPSGRLAAMGIYVYREKAIKQLTDMLIFGDDPSGEIFYLNVTSCRRAGRISTGLCSTIRVTRRRCFNSSMKRTSSRANRRRRGLTCAWVSVPRGKSLC
jgi:hypothetical protein